MKIWLESLILILMVGLNGLKGAGNVSLTTARMRYDTSPKPTVVHRRINVEKNFEKKTINPMDLFRLGIKDRRRSPSRVWNWDYWCQMQKKPGNCSSPTTRFYYNAQLDHCMTFVYSGCGGNKNRFETLTECGRFCKGATYMPSQNSSSKIFCSLQPDAGLCMAMFYKYYYDVNDNTCKTFIYGGCGGNQNRFNTIGQCVQECRGDTDYAYAYADDL